MAFAPAFTFRPSLSMKALASSALVASLSFSPLSPLVRPAQADSSDVVAGLIIGGIIGGAIASEESKKKKKSTKKSTKSKSKSTKAKAPSISPEQKAANVEVQEALNHFGWAVGTADGAIGPKSKSAIKEYQAFLGFPATGELTEHERTVLVTAYHRAKAGGSAISEIVSGSVYGMRGVLIAQADEMASAPAGTLAAGPKAEASPQPGSVAAAAAAAIPALLPKPAEEPTVAAPAAPIAASPKPSVEPAPEPPVTAVVEVAPPVVAPVVTPEPEEVAVVPEVVTPEPEAPEVADTKETEPTGPGLPTFLDANGGKGTLLAACNSAAMQTAANGGPATEATLTDAGLALTEQFCLARGEAIAQSQTLMAGIAGFTPEQISQQCAGMAPALAEHVAALSLKPRDEVLAGVESFILETGMSPAQLSGTAKVCLGLGYAEERQDVAIGSALLLVALGEGGYAELPGHHLVRGFGATERPDLAEAWYETAAEAMGQGGAVFAPAVAGRDALILKAAYALTGKAPLVAPEVKEAALPTFVVTPEPEAAPVAPVSAPAVDGAAVQGPGAEAMRMSAGFARLAVEAPLLLLGATSP